MIAAATSSPPEPAEEQQPADEQQRAADQHSARRWLAHMLNGDFESAWNESDAIRARGAFDPHRFWDGTPLDGTRVILRCLHGLGDAIQFLRYAEKLQSLARDLVVEVPPTLLPLAPHIRGIHRVVSWGSCAPIERVEWDKQIEVMELPYYFRTVLRELPIAEKYIHLPNDLETRVDRAMGPAMGPRIGLVWAAGNWNPARSLPFSELTQLLAIHECEFWNLQGAADHDAWNHLPPHPRLRDGMECGDGLLVLAALIRSMDLVITVDTLAAHLAGAMGKPAWVLLEHDADWRWMAGRSDSPWYPSLRLFRQPAPNDWRGLVLSVTDQLHRYLRSSEASPDGR